MNSHDEQRLSDALRREAATQDPHLLSLDDVTSRARGIRRRRVATGLVAAAAVVAVVVPTAIVAAERDDSTSPPVATQTPDATPTGTQEPTPTGGPTPTDPASPRKRTRTSVVGDLPTGAGPGIAVLVGDQVLTPGGDRVKVGADAVYVGMVGDSVVSIERTGDSGTFFVRSTDGSVVQQRPASVDGGLSVTPDHTASAYVADDGRIHTWSSADGDLTFSAPMQDIQLGPMSGSEPGTCKEQAPEGGGCTVVFNRGAGGAGYATSHGIVDDIPAFLKVNAATDRVYAGQTQSNPEGSCSEIRRIDTGRTTFKTCHNTLGPFSPDGTHIEAGPAYLDGLCCATSDVLDAGTGKPVLTLEARGRTEPSYIREVGWEDDSHVLAVVLDGSAWRLVRVDLNGSAELVDIGQAPTGDVGEVPVKLAVGS